MTEGREVLATAKEKPLPEGLRGLGAPTGNWEFSKHTVALTPEEKEAAKGIQFPGFQNPLHGGVVYLKEEPKGTLEESVEEEESEPPLKN